MPGSTIYVIQPVREGDTPLYLVYPDEGGHHPIFINQHLAAVVAGLFDRNAAADKHAVDKAKQGLLEYCEKLSTKAPIDEVTDIYSVFSKVVKKTGDTLVNSFSINRVKMFVGYGPDHLPRHYSTERVDVERKMDLGPDVEATEVNFKL